MYELRLSVAPTQGVMFRRYVKEAWCFAETALGQLHELHKVETWMAILAELQHGGWCEDKSALACLIEDLV